MIDVHYFASIRERLGCSSEQLEAAAGITDIATLIDRLVAVHGATWHSVLREGQVLMAVNKTVARSDTPVADGDEVAFFPPVTGG